jgi:hypothetical protein
MTLEADRATDETAISAPRSVPTPAGVAPGPGDPVLYADAPGAPDLLGAAVAVQPLAELCLAANAQTPFLVGILGRRGAGKSFALRRLVGAIEGLAAGAGKLGSSPLLSRAVIAEIDAAGFSGDPASALASAAFVALERDGAGGPYAALADEAAHGAIDPHRAAASAAERHDEISARLEAERSARDEVEAKRARLPEALLFETPGSRIDAFIRTRRGVIDSRLRRFGMAEGDSAANYRNLIRDFSSRGAVSRAGLVLRSIWAFGGQLRLLLLALTAFLLAFAVNWLRGPDAARAMQSLGETAAPVAGWIGSHGDWLQWADEALIALGLLALLVNIWRAVSFSSLLYRGLRLLNMDVRDRRRELDASAARLDRRIAGLTLEAEAASKRAETLAKRVGGGAVLARAPGPVFLKSLESSAKASREFFAELARLMNAPDSKAMPAPQRLIFAIDNLEALAPGEAARLIETARALLGPGCIGLVACDPLAIAPAAGGASSPREWEQDLFHIAFDAGTIVEADPARLAARLISTSTSLPPLGEFDASRSAVAEPLSSAEIAVLSAMAPLVGGSPRAVKRFHNAYRLARLAKAPRPLIALALAALQSPDREIERRLREAAHAEGGAFADPSGPTNLVAATQAARAAHGEPIAAADARAAWSAARRYAPQGL